LSAENSIVLGLGVISATLGYFAFELGRSDEDLSKKIGLVLGFMSLAFLNLVMYAIYKIASVNLSYLVDGVLHTGILILMWTTLSLVFILLLVVIWISIKSLYIWSSNFGKRKDNTNED
jgi:hypothetical protein